MNIHYTETDILAVLQQYAGDTGIRSLKKVEEDYTHVAERLSAEAMTTGLSEAFRSENTPAFAETVSQSYERGDAGQRADILTRLIDGTSTFAGRPVQDAGMFEQSEIAYDTSNVATDPNTTEQCRPELVEHIACQVEQEDDETVDKMSGYYAGNPTVAKTLGGAMLGTVLRNIAETR